MSMDIRVLEQIQIVAQQDKEADGKLLKAFLRHEGVEIDAASDLDDKDVRHFITKHIARAKKSI